MTDADVATDDALIERLHRSAFGYFREFVNVENGLVADTSRDGSPCSIAVVGFALSCYPVAVARGWMSRYDAIAIARATLRFFVQSGQGEGADTSGYKGLFYHFLDMKTGRRVWECELSLIDTALLMAGILTAGIAFEDDAEIVQLVDMLYRRVDWLWSQNGTPTVAQGWKPECGFLHYGWEGYNEATILYVLGLGSPENPFTDDVHKSWRLTYQWENLGGADVLYCGPLFTHLFSHAWIDFRDLRDAFMREKGSDYFQNTRSAIAIHRRYGERNPHNYVGYSRDCWGITAGEGPTHTDLRIDGRDRRFFGYMSRGAPYGPDDGTLSPWAMLATLPFEPEAAMTGTRHLLAAYPQVCPQGRFASGFNPTLLVDGEPWVSQGWFGLDQGLLTLMIENFRTGLTWSLFRKSPFVVAGLRRAGFEGGWLTP